VSRLLQPITFGKIDGSASSKLKEIMEIFRAVGFPTAFTPNMNAYQKTHVAWFSPVAKEIYMVNGDNHQLSRSPHIVRLLVRAVREDFQVLQSLQIPITPAKLQMWKWMPEGLMVQILRLWANTNHFRTVAVEPTLAATDEMRQLADEFRFLAVSISIKTPAIVELRSFIPKTGLQANATAKSYHDRAA
jgi:2-dehydropantoate 2-reductase